MRNIGIITGNLKKNMTGIGSYSYNIIEGLKENYIKQRNIQMEGGNIVKVSDKGFRSGISKQIKEQNS